MVTVSRPCVDGVRLQCQIMTNYTELASVQFDPPDLRDRRDPMIVDSAAELAAPG
jgi:hypothetical protein